MKNLTIIQMLMLISFSTSTFCQTSLGTVQPNTNNALPSSYNFQEYVFAEPSDQGRCNGATNNTAEIIEVFTAQTHLHAIGHPLFFTIGHRPALLQVAVEGTGMAPDVTVKGTLNGSNLGTLCLNGPEVLSNTIDLDTPDFNNYFSVTLPKSWIINGLELTISTGNDTRIITPDELKIGPYTEMNLVMVNIDVLDYNTENPFFTIYDDFLQELASAIPASVVRFGVFPVTIKLPQLIASNNTEQLIQLESAEDLGVNGIFDEGNINSVANLFAANIQRATGDYLSTIYFGNTLNLTPGGWGGGRNFVSFDYGDIFIHELGHAMSLPHWESVYNVNIDSEDSFLYPYGGDTDDGGGRGEAWNFIQDTYEYVSPFCEDNDNQNLGIERSDCMQREFACLETRTNDFGPWDGFGDFSAKALHRHMYGADAEAGNVPYRGGTKSYQLGFQDGYPLISMENGERVYARPDQYAQGTYPEISVKLPGQELAEQDVFLVYGTTHPTQDQANIVYDPIKYNGTLSPVLDPIDPVTFDILKNIEPNGDSPLYSKTRDITLKLIYQDGSILHAIVPQHSFDRESSDDFGVWRNDLCNFVLVVPGEVDLCQVELYHRPFVVSDEENNIEGNINFAPHNITPENFMDAAVLKAENVCSILPIELLSFDAHKKSNRVQLDWSTANEVNNSHFEIERSSDGKKFSLIESVKGAGNSNTLLKYTSYDHSPIEGRNYYRLKQVDVDGKFEYSDLVVVNFSKNSTLQIYPNPASQRIFIYSDQNNSSIQIIDVRGRLIHSQKGNVTEIDLSSFESGIYYLQLLDSNNHQITGKKIVVTPF